MCDRLRNWDPSEKFVGSTIAKEFGFNRTDAGHKIKLLALDLNEDIPNLEITPSQKVPLRSLKIQV